MLTAVMSFRMESLPSSGFSPFRAHSAEPRMMGISSPGYLGAQCACCVCARACVRVCVWRGGGWRVPVHASSKHYKHTRTCRG